MAVKKPKRVREQVVVYLDKQDRVILEKMARETGLARTELFRRGLWRLAGETLTGPDRPGSSIDYLIETAAHDDFPPDVAERHDYYLYGGGYEKWLEKKKGEAKKKGGTRKKRAGIR